MNDIVKRLAEPFAPSQVSWRAQSVTKDGTKAMALAYIDARDVMNRLDEVVGAEGWQCRYSHADKKTICEIGIKIGDAWVWKANGAGDTDIEAEKGAISDAFKRAAVMWGIGRYLYDMPSPWVPCESVNGKWRSWKQDPAKEAAKLMSKQPAPKTADKPKPTLEDRFNSAMEAIKGAGTEAAFNKLTGSQNYRTLLGDLDGKPEKATLMNTASQRYAALTEHTHTTH